MPTEDGFIVLSNFEIHEDDESPEKQVKSSVFSYLLQTKESASPGNLASVSEVASNTW